MYQTVLILHLLGATIWTGGHLLLTLTVLPPALRRKDPDILLAFEQNYERAGMSALAVQIATGLWLAWYWMPDLSRWFSFSSPVADMIALKLGLLAATIATALSARFFVLPRLTPQRLPLMAAHVIAVTFFSVLFVVAGAGLRTGGF